jgi:formylglycine-generating enzyme required for sulfatase activity
MGRSAGRDNPEKNMVLIPAGTFLYGDGEGKRELPAFRMGRTPGTNAEYARFVTAVGYEPPGHWEGGTPSREIADHPVTHVSWHDAVAYAERAGAG